MGNVQESNAKITNTPGIVMETRFANEATNMEREDCSTSDVTIQESVYCSKRLRRSRSHASGLSRRRKRWRGRVENLNCTNDESYAGTREDATADRVCLDFKILNFCNCISQCIVIGQLLIYLFSIFFYKKIYRVWRLERKKTMIRYWR
jgi:hypothetical protein